MPEAIPSTLPTEQAIKYAMLVSSPEFQQLLKSIVDSPVRNKLYASEAALVVGLFLFRVWRSRSISTFVGRLVFQLWTLVAYVGIGSYVIPRYWYGANYDRLLSMIKPVLPPWVLPYWPF